MALSKWLELGVEVGACPFYDGCPLGLWAGEMACLGPLILFLLCAGRQGSHRTSWSFVKPDVDSTPHMEFVQYLCDLGQA